MQILLAAATEMEIAPFMQNHPSADILVTGVGAPATIYQLTKRIQLIDYDLVIQAGIAGSFIPGLELGKVVAVKADTFGDIGIQTKSGLSTIFEEGLADPDHLPYSNGWLINKDLLLEVVEYEKVNGITVNTVTDDKEHINSLSAKYKTQIETMEGAALHYVCLLEEVPFIQIRSISNYIGERDKGKWRIPEAVKNLNSELEVLYKKLLHGLMS